MFQKYILVFDFEHVFILFDLFIIFINLIWDGGSREMYDINWFDFEINWNFEISHFEAQNGQYLTSKFSKKPKKLNLKDALKPKRV